MRRVLLLTLALAAMSCGNPTPPPVTTRPDAAVADLCEGVLCLPGETCNPRSGCYCTEGTCPLPAICNEQGRCENLCASAVCAEGEACVPKTGRCECGNGTSPCPTDRFCNEATKRCETRCTTSCPRGENCDPATGVCHCADCGAEGLGCDPTTDRCVNRCPATCPAGERCDDKVVGECHCSETSCAAGQVCDAATRRCVDLCQGKACNPGERCDSRLGTCVCDVCGSRDKCNPVTNRCEPKCTGVQCPAGEACVDTSGECHCGLSPNTCPAGQKCEAATLKCVGMCEGVTCPVAGERCNATTGACECTSTPDSCTAVVATTRCDAATKKCTAQCAGVSCAPGESCAATSGLCQCQASPADTCSAAAPTLRCSTSTLHCEEKCRGVSCPTGEACVPTNGECHCGIPNTCPAGKKCDTSNLTCVGLCSGVNCSTPGESCVAATGVCACTTSPDSCTSVDPSSKCDVGARKCVSQCAGVGCAPGESCNLGSGACECVSSPSDSCTAAVSTMRCDAGTKKCISKCDGVTCSQGESCLSASGACACGVSPNTCPAGKKCDPSTLHCVALCSGVTCTTGGESCDAATGTCVCTVSPDSCTASSSSTRCDSSTRKCVSKCQGVYCAAGETCTPATGLCACTTAPDSCSAADATQKCNATSKRCQSKCTGVTCPTGETCTSTTGLCQCNPAAPACPVGQRCDAATTRCVAACSGVTCSVPGESCDAATGACRCTATPTDTCTAAASSTRCDTSTNRCVSKCSGISCSPGESCDSGTCRCTTSPDSCTASGQKCDGGTLRCVALCSGVSCPAGETCNPASGACECTTESCLANYRCNASKHCEACAQETDAAFCARQPAECGTVSGTDNCGRARTVSCGTCTLPKSCSTGFCLAAGAPRNDDCIGAVPLVFDGSGKATVTGDTTNATDSGRAAVCSVGFGPDVVYSFTTTAVKTVDLSLTFASGGSPVLYVRKVCASPSTTDEVNCSDGIGTGVASLSLANLPAGTYWVWADGYTSTKGAFTLTVQQSTPVTVPPNDTCSTPTTLSFTGDVATVTGDTRMAADNYSGTCIAALGGDVVYAIDLATARSVTAVVTRDASTATYLPTVYLRKVCTSALTTDQLGCGAQTAGVATAIAPTAGPGRIYVVVDGASATSGKFTLQVTLGTAAVIPTNDTCSSPTALSFTNEEAEVTGSTTWAAGNGSGTCGGTGNDLVYSLTLAKTASIAAWVTPSTSSPTYQPVVYIRRVACEGTSAVEEDCGAATAAAGTAFAIADTVPAGNYWIWVDGYGSTKGDFTMNVITWPLNDICDYAFGVDANVTYLANSNYALNDYGGASSTFSTACRTSNYGASGPEVVFEFQAPATGTYTFSVTPAADSTSFDPAIWVMPAPCGNNPGSCLAFKDAAGGGSNESVSFSATKDQLYYLVVDHYSATTSSSSTGAFTFSITGP